MSRELAEEHNICPVYDSNSSAEFLVQFFVQYRLIDRFCLNKPAVRPARRPEKSVVLHRCVERIDGGFQ